MNDKMPGRLKNIRTVFIVTLLVAVLAVLSDRVYFSNLEWKYRTYRLDKQLIEKEIKSARLLEDIEKRLTDGVDPTVMFHETTGREALAEGIVLLIYKNNAIAYWSDNSIAFPPVVENRFETHKPVFLSNGWFIPVRREMPGFEILALIKVYRQYPIDNNLLREGFLKSYRLPEEARITFNESETQFRINGIEKEFHFGIIFPEKKPNTAFIVVPLLMWIFFLLLLIRLIYITSGWLALNVNKTVAGIAGPAAILLLYIVPLLAGLPPSVRSTGLFSPFLWSAGKFLPSVGHLTLLGIVLIPALNLIFRSGFFQPPWRGTYIKGELLSGALFVAGFLTFLVTERLFRDLVLNSAISFEAYNILGLSFMSLAAFVSVLLMLALTVMLFMQACRLMEEWPLTRSLSVILIAALVLIPGCLFMAGCSYWGIIFVILLAFAVLFLHRESSSMLSQIVVYAVLTGIFTTIMVVSLSEVKEDKNLKVMAITLAHDNDMVAENMLIDLWPSLESDSVLAAMMQKEIYSSEDLNNIYRYLQATYFNGYWENYDLNMVVCRSDSPLEIASTGSTAGNCFAYFDDRIKNEGDTITGTGFWFMHNQAGRAYYLTRLLYNVSPSLTNGLFIELISHIETYLAGYPELLLEASYQRYPMLRDISYAKYSDSTLVMMSGDFPYDNDIDPVKYNDEYTFVTKNGYRHLYYNNGEMTLAVTTRAVTFLDWIITFAYLFVVILVFAFVLLLILLKHKGDLLTFDTFRRRLQVSFAGVLAVVFIIIISGALALSSRQFRNNHSRLLREKLASVSIELEHKLSSQKTLEQDWHDTDYASLNQLLVKFSNVFFTDINLYAPSGNLLATSRPEVFTQRLQGGMINPVAYGRLTEEGRDEYIGDEKIGNLVYLSAYMPFYNNDNKLLAYINLPYFAMQNLLAGEISNLLVTLINFTLLLMMVMMWLSVFLSERITSPLSMLQEAMASVEYGRKNEHIAYRSRDEVGELVRQYNRMIDELEDSAGKLARSEREMAWREMARQVAHEIKNPLTPMKLNVQQLFRWWNDRVPDFDSRIKSFTENQIEYIDNLSNIASAFSYFARLPGAEPTEVDILAQLRSTLEMFGKSDNTIITLDSGNISKAVIMADREHINGIFSNLLKNALQAIPADRKGRIEIKLSATHDTVQVRISDNGAGIPDELKSRMFTPNFTTKSSGMGLGLSIVKRYVETAGGTIWFESEHDKGTSFIVELPLLYTVERSEKKGI
jgi:signal transduction histidine kinase